MLKRFVQAVLASFAAAALVFGVSIPAQAWWQSYEYFPSLTIPGESSGQVLGGWVDYKGYNGGGRQVFSVAIRNSGDVGEEATLYLHDTLNGGSGVGISTIGEGTNWKYRSYPLDSYAQTTIASADAYIYVRVCNEGGSCTARSQVLLTP